jgi:hypothetical protein
MTQDEIMTMARQAGFEGCAELTWEDVICTEELVAFAKLVAQHEREACAKLLEDTADGAKKVDPKGFVWQAIQKSAEFIRARGQA